MQLPISPKLALSSTALIVALFASADRAAGQCTTILNQPDDGIAGVLSSAKDTSPQVLAENFNLATPTVLERVTIQGIFAGGYTPVDAEGTFELILYADNADLPGTETYCETGFVISSVATGPGFDVTVTLDLTDPQLLAPGKHWVQIHYRPTDGMVPVQNFFWNRGSSVDDCPGSAITFGQTAKPFTFSSFVGPYSLEICGSPGTPSLPLLYCTPKTSSSGCVTTISTSDLGSQPTSGSGGYMVTASMAHEIRNGLLFAGNSGPAATPFSGGTLCMTPPLRRGPIMNSGGDNPLECDGSFSTLVNDGMVLPAGLDAGAGNSAWYQYWYRDPLNGAGTLGTALSNAVQLDFQ